MARCGFSIFIAAAALLLAAVADGQCPSEDQFGACVDAAKFRYDQAIVGIDASTTCFKARSCEFLKDTYMCAVDISCCSEAVLAKIAGVDDQMRPLGVFQTCDAVNMCLPTTEERVLPAGCCPMAVGALSSRRVCCRSSDCSLCNKTAGEFVLGNQQVTTDAHVTLEAINVGTMCPDGTSDGTRQGFICNKQCSSGASLSSTNNDFVYHAVVSATVPYSHSECTDCCILSFDSPDDLPCSTGCRSDTASCHMCNIPADFEPRPAAPARCTGFLDRGSCSMFGVKSKCGGHACR